MEIKILKFNEGNAVSARELYQKLQITTDFSTWCKRMFEYGFANGQDYSLLKIGEPDGQAYVKKTDYALSLDCAKEICMIQRTEIGRAVRQYFIECEKKIQTQLPATYAEALRELAYRVELEEKIKSQLEAQKPAVEFYNAVAESQDALPMADVAKVLNIGIGRNELFKKLRDKKILMNDNKPYQEYIDRGYFRVVEQRYNKPDGSTHISIKTLVYQKGVQYIQKILS